MTEACFECGDEAQHQHHVVPRSLGGTKTVPVCVTCHGLIHSREAMAHPELTRKALQYKKAQGQRVGTVPFGFKLAKNGVRLIPDQRQQQLLSWMRRQRERGITLQAICDELERVGDRTAKGLRTWEKTTVHRLVRGVAVKRLRRHERPQIEPLETSMEVQRQISLFDTATPMQPRSRD